MSGHFWPYSSVAIPSNANHVSLTGALGPLNHPIVYTGHFPPVLHPERPDLSRSFPVRLNSLFLLIFPGCLFCVVGQVIYSRGFLPKIGRELRARNWSGRMRATFHIETWATTANTHPRTLHSVVRPLKIRDFPRLADSASPGLVRDFSAFFTFVRKTPPPSSLVSRVDSSSSESDFPRCLPRFSRDTFRQNQFPPGGSRAFYRQFA